MLQVKGDYYSGSFGAADNMLTLRVRVDGGEWISLLYVKNGNAYTSVSTLHGLDYTTEHTIEVSAADKLASVSRTAKVYKGVPIFDFGESDGILNVPMRFARGLDIVTGRGYASDLDADETALQAWLDTQLEAMADFSFRPIAWSCYPAITGSTVYGFLSRHEVGYGIFFGWSYDGHTYLLRKNRGVWSPAQASTDTGDSGGGTGSGGETSYGTCPAAASAAAKTGAIAGVTLETGACVLAQSQIQGAARGLCVLSPGTLRTLQAAAHEAFEAPVQARTEPVVELAAGVSGRAAEGARLNVWETPELCTLERTRAEAEGLLIADRGLDGAAALISGVKSVRASAVPAAAPAGEVAVCHRDNAASSLGMGARQQTGLHGKDAAAAECGTVWGLAEPVTGEAIPSANAALDLALEGKRGAFTRPKAAAQNASFSGAAAQSGIRPAVSALASGHGKAILAGGRSVSESAVRPETAPALSLSLAARSSVQAGAKLSAAEVESMAAQPGMGSSASCNLGLPLMQGAQGIVGLATQSAGDTGRGFGLASHTGAEAGTAVVLQSSAVSWKDPVQVGNRLTIYQSHHVTQSGARLRIQ